MTDIATFSSPRGTIRVVARKVGARRRQTKPRMYVGADETFNVLEDLENRRRRPHSVWRKAVRELFAESGIPFDLSVMGWTQFAGCACGCSPGFVIERQTVAEHGIAPWTAFDVYVTLKGVPTVDETKPARELVSV